MFIGTNSDTGQGRSSFLPFISRLPPPSYSLTLTEFPSWKVGRNWEFEKRCPTGSQSQKILFTQWGKKRKTVGHLFDFVFKKIFLIEKDMEIN